MLLLKNLDMTFGEGVIFSIIAMLIVFVVLMVIVLIVNAMSKIDFKEKKEESKPQAQNNEVKNVEIKDDDMMVACLVVTAEFVEETKTKDARIVSVKEL